MARTDTSGAMPPGSNSDYLPGQVIGDKYRLEKLIGEGGMASVWLATNFVLDVSVAVKLIRTDSQAEDSASRLLQEARAVARLGHPAIVRIFDFGQTLTGAPFIAMELLHGETLADVLDRDGALSAVKAVQVMLPIADGLAAAHSKGIIHRDLKPENIFLARDEAGRLQPKVLDFGIAKLSDEGVSRKITLDGNLLGSPDYMAPEQALGLDNIDHRSDVWAFCVVLYEMISGQPPFEGKNYNALLRSIVNDPAPPLIDKGLGDADLWTILETGLKKEPEDRWEGIRELGEALAFWLYRRGVTEDVCAASLSATWLESGLSGVKLRLHSTVPPAMRGQAPGPDGSVPPVSGPRVSSPDLSRSDPNWAGPQSRTTTERISNPTPIPVQTPRPPSGSSRSDRPVYSPSVIPREVAKQARVRSAIIGSIVTGVVLAGVGGLVYALTRPTPPPPTIEPVQAIAAAPNAEANPVGTAAPTASATTTSETAPPTPSTSASAEAAAPSTPNTAPIQRGIPRTSGKKKASKRNDIDMGF